MNDLHSDDSLEERDLPGERDQPEVAPQRGTDNDQDSHVSPPDNDGETVPQDEVVDQVGG